MISRLSIKHFQSHKNTVLDFSPGVNVLIGQSDCGKTAILRALQWVLTNKPAGTSFISNFAGDKAEASVTLECDGHCIIRARNKGSVNFYSVDGTLLKAFGAGEPPEEVRDIAKMFPINISYQLDAPFLLSGSAGEVARYFNQISGLDKIDTALSNVASQLSAHKRDKQLVETALEDLKTQIATYSTLGQLEAQLLVVEKLILTQEQKQLRQAFVKKQITEISAMQQKLKAAERISALTLPYEVLTQKLHTHATLEEQHTKLFSKTRSLARLVTKSEECDTWLKVATPASALEKIVNSYQQQAAQRKQLVFHISAIKDLQSAGVSDATLQQSSNLLERFVTHSSISCKKTALQDFCRAIERILARIDVLVARTLEHEEELHKIMPEECPLCGSQVNV